MVHLSQLWLPIVLSAAIVFVASSLLHMVFKYHDADYKQFSNEDDVRTAITKGGVGAGQYILPYTRPEDMRSAAAKQKYADGPVGLVLLRAPGAIKMGPLLGAWLVYALAISALAAYLASRTLAPGAAYPAVFRVVGTAAALGYSGAHAQIAIWKGEPWPAALKDIIDGIIYGLLTAGMFAWLWPAA